MLSIGWRALASLGSGALLATAFPPVESHEAAWMALIPLLLVARSCRRGPAFRWGFAGGLVFWLCSLAWLLRLGVTGAPMSLAALGWVLLSAYCALYTGAFAACTSALWDWTRTPRRPGDEHEGGTLGRNLVLLAAVPVLWVGFEYLRSTILTGFAWNQLGISQYRNLPLIQVAEWGGVYAVSGLVVLVNTSLSLAAIRFMQVYWHRGRARVNVELAAGLLVFAVCLIHGLKAVKRYQPDSRVGTSMRLAAIQPNIPQPSKWESQSAGVIYDTLEEHTRLAHAFGPDLDLVIWPETALPFAIPADSATLRFVRDLASGGVPLLVGAIEAEDVGGDPSPKGLSGAPIYNSSFLFDTDGRILDVYRKQHLVPFGEYLPFDRRIALLRRIAPLGYSCTPGDRATVFSLPCKRAQTSGPGADRSRPVFRFAALICFEDTIAPLSRHFVLQGARLLVNQTNDAWFDGLLRWAGARQHMSHSVFRCVENRVPLVRCANTGVTCVIDPSGRIDNVDLMQDENWWTGVARYDASAVHVPDENMPLTVYTRYGDRPFALPCGLVAVAALGAVVLLSRRARRTRRDR